MYIQLVRSCAAGESTPAFHNEEIDTGRGQVVRPWHTQGHTPEHTSHLVLIDGEPAALFSGGTLLAGSTGRPDLLGPERAHSLGVLQHGSRRRPASVPPAARPGAQVLDVRMPHERADAPLEGAVECFLPELNDGVPAVLDEREPVLIACGTGRRAAIAATLLARNGFRPVDLTGAGAPDVASRARAAA